jgi:hypothetical protein
VACSTDPLCETHPRSRRVWDSSIVTEGGVSSRKYDESVDEAMASLLTAYDKLTEETAVYGAMLENGRLTTSLSNGARFNHDDVGAVGDVSAADGGKGSGGGKGCVGGGSMQASDQNSNLSTSSSLHSSKSSAPGAIGRRCGGGVGIRVTDHAPHRVVQLQRGGSAERSGNVKVGDVLVGVGQTSVSDKTVRWTLPRKNIPKNQKNQCFANVRFGINALSTAALVGKQATSRFTPKSRLSKPRP